MIDNPFEVSGNFVPGVAWDGPDNGYWFCFQQGHLLLTGEQDAPCLPTRLPPLLRAGDATPHFLGCLDGVPCFAQAVDVPPTRLTALGLWGSGLRGLHGRLPQDLFLLAGRAYQVLEWDRSHRYCGACGTPTERHAMQRARVCPTCGMAQYPRLTPAMMALVRRDDALLLARSPRFPEGMFSALAGFVEPGETLEGCVRREVEEEVGIRVGGLRYFASQSWPFPHSLMVAYIADYVEGDIRIDGEEIVEAAWFPPTALPRIPAELSIAGHLIRTVARSMRC